MFALNAMPDSQLKRPSGHIANGNTGMANSNNKMVPHQQ
jgi:hypothetical protein